MLHSYHDFMTKMDYRKYLIAALAMFLGIGGAVAQTDGMSFGALDVVMATAPEQKSATDMADVLAMVASARTPEMRRGALDFISKSAAQADFYTSGLFESLSGAKGSGAKWTGDMLSAPTWGKITSKFGFRPKFGRMHKGIDIAMTVGDTVCVPLPGVVDRISYEAAGYGHYVVVKHDNGLETRYAHLSGTLVNPGERVIANQPIALSGNTGNSTGPHLHFETRVMGSAIDPLTVFDFAGGMMTPKVRVQAAPVDMKKVTVGALAGVAAKGIPGRSLDEKRTYVVKSGDTLERIAARAGVSVADICRLNGFTAAEPLQPGSMIRLRR